MTKNLQKQFVPSFNSCSNDRFMKISNASIDKRTLDDINPCTNRVVLCRETDCDVAFWKINTEEHYKALHPQVNLEEIPKYVRLPPQEIDLYKNEQKNFNHPRVY